MCWSTMQVQLHRLHSHHAVWHTACHHTFAELHMRTVAMAHLLSRCARRVTVDMLLIACAMRSNTVRGLLQPMLQNATRS